MIFAVLDHLWQSTLLAGAIAMLALVFRNAGAAVRYGLWLTASVKFLVPFAALAAVGRQLAPELRPPATGPDVVFIAQAAAPLTHAAIPVQAGLPIDPILVALGLWALGSAIVLGRWAVRWTRIRALVRLGTPVALAAPMPVLTTPMMMEPGLVGFSRPVLLIPEALFDHLDRPGIEALVAHEACHYRRRDNLTAAVHMLVEALFWFHPMVWWIGGRLVIERERACDEAVVGAGHDPAVYAQGLLECCRLFLQSPLRCVAGASGSNLSRRVETIMTSPLRPSLSRSGKAALAAAGICALATPVAAGWLASPPEQPAMPATTIVAPGPASALPADASRPDADTVASVRTSAPRPATVRFAAAHRERMQLEPVADDQSPPPLATPLLAATTFGTPDARLIPASDTQSPSSDGDKRYCMVARADQPPPNGPAAKVLCMTRSEWKQAIVPPPPGHKTCWTGRYGCTPEGQDGSSDHAPGYGGSTFPQITPGEYAQPRSAPQDIHFGPAPSYSFAPPPTPRR